MGMESKSFCGVCKWCLLYSWAFCCWVFLLVFEKSCGVWCVSTDLGHLLTSAKKLQKKLWLLLKTKLLTCQHKCIKSECLHLRKNHWNTSAVKKERAISLHTEFTPPHLVSAVLLVSIMLFPAQVLQSTVLCSLRANSPQQIDILRGEVVKFQGSSDMTTL